MFTPSTKSMNNYVSFLSVGVISLGGSLPVQSYPQVQVNFEPIKSLKPNLPELILSVDPQTNLEVPTLATQFVETLAREDFKSAVQQFDSTMQTKVSPEALQSFWADLTTILGKFQRHLAPRTLKTQQDDVVLVPCQFEKGTVTVKTVFNSDKKITGLQFIPTDRAAFYKSPSYVNPANFQQQKVQIGSDHNSLPGTLTIPVGKGPFPVVLLVHGSGPNDQDETIGPNKPFRDLS